MSVSSAGSDVWVARAEKSSAGSATLASSQPGEGLDAAGGGVLVVLEDHEHLVAGEVAVRRGRREPPQGHVLELLLPPGEQAGRHVPGGGRPVELGEPAGAVGVGVVGRQPGLVEEPVVGVVQRGDGASQLGGEPGARRAGPTKSMFWPGRKG